MRRRDFIVGLGGAVATCPLVARAQQHTVPLIGYLSGTTEQSFFDAAFRREAR